LFTFYNQLKSKIVYFSGDK